MAIDDVIANAGHLDSEATIAELQSQLKAIVALRDEQKARADELALSLNAHVLHRQKLVTALEREFGSVSGWGTDEPPEDALLRLLREQVTNLALANEKAALLAEENLGLSNRNWALRNQNEGLQAEQLQHNEEVAAIVKSLENLDPGLGLKPISNVVIYAAGQLDKLAGDIVELREDLQSAEEEAARFSKENRQMSARSRELLAEIASLKKAQTEPPSKTASPLDRIPSDLPLDLKTALDRANAMIEARGPGTPSSSPPDFDDLLIMELAKLNAQGEVIDLSLITKAPLTGDSFETFANYFIIEAIVSLDRRNGQPSDTMGKVFGHDRTASGRDKITGAKISLMINGVALPFLDVLRRFHEQWDVVVQKAALEHVKEQFEDKTSAVFTLLDDLKDRLEATLGVPRDE
jgi:hypothetical protein